jgi:hypothetical protein
MLPLNQTGLYVALLMQMDLVLFESEVREQEFEFTTLDSKILPPSPIYTDNNLSRSKFTI